MAKKTASKNASKPAMSDSGSRTRKRRRGNHFFIYILMGILLMLSPPIAALLIVGLLPTLVILFVDIGQFKALRLNAMFAFNLAGVLPFLVELWDAGPSMEQFKAMAGDLSVWAVMYGAAFAGAAMLWLGPVLAASTQQLLNGEAARRVDRHLRMLVDEWGEEVAQSNAAQDRKRQQPREDDSRAA